MVIDESLKKVRQDYNGQSLKIIDIQYGIDDRWAEIDAIIAEGFTIKAIMDVGRDNMAKRVVLERIR